MPLLLDTEDLVKVLAARTPGGFQRQPLTGVSIDSRAVRAGHLFIGLKGDRTHGQRFAEAALSAGAGAAIVEDVDEARCRGRSNVLVVPNSERALQDASRAVRARVDIPLVGVTGTNGKTTTKQVVATVLEANHETVHATRGNFNNHLGLPISLLSMPESCDAGVFELGMSNPGEIDFIAGILRPTIGVVTMVGEAHLETMGTIERIVSAKAELISHLPADGLLLLNADCPWHVSLASRYAGRTLLVGVTEGDEPRGLAAELLSPHTGFDFVEGRLVLKGEGCLGALRLPIAGVHVATSFLFASLIARELGANVAEIPQALRQCKPVWGRMETRTVEGVRVVHDGYNANPASMVAALRHLAAVDGGGRWAVLGEMLELGAARDRAHLDVAGEALSLLGTERVFFLGEVYEDIRSSWPKARVFGTLASLCSDLARRFAEGDTILIKASRGVAIERVLDMLFHGT